MRMERSLLWGGQLVSLLFLGLSTTASADWWGDDCRQEQRLTHDVDFTGVRSVKVEAGAGALEIRGERGLTSAEVVGQACARSQRTLEQIDLAVERRDDTLMIASVLPRNSDDARLSLEIRVPDDVAVILRDSSGSLAVADVRQLELTDSSGSITVERIAEDVHILSDSSGSIDLRRVGDVRIDRDSSGSITVEQARSLVVQSDTSGSINARDIEGDVTVVSDTSGSIDVARVAGSFTVERDTSGGIRHDAVVGEVRIPRQ
ncbi:MAG: hypothetical protein AAFX85_00315 [Pseudomonadota bacterium]